MNARDVVALLLEADEPSASDKTGVYIFGPKLPAGAYVSSMEQAISDFKRYGVIPKEAYAVEQVMDYLVRKGYTFFLKKAPGDIEVIGRVPARTTPDGQQRASQFLGLERHNQVQHRATITSTPKAMNVDYVLFGSRELEQRQREQEKTAKEQAEQAEKAKEAAKAQRGVPTKKLGVIDPEEHGWKDPPTGVGYSGDFMPLNAPLEVGFVYSETPEGLRVEEVVPGGPAAQAGLQAGSIVYGIEPFKAQNSDEQLGAFSLNKGKHLEYVLRKADPEHLLTFRVYKGGQPVHVPIKPEPRKQQQPQATGSEIHIPGEEARQFFQRPKAKRAGPTQRTFTRKLMRPNEPSPSRETGNEPPNVSSIT